MQKRNTLDMTVGSPMKLLFMFSLPILFGAFLHQFYNLTDTVIVGNKLGNDALAAVGATSSLVSLFFSIAQGLTKGFSIVVSQYFGAQDHKKMRQTLALTVVFSFAFTFIITIIGLVYAKPLLILLKTPEAILPDSLIYIRIIFAGLLLTMIYNACGSVLQAVGNSVAPLAFLAIAAVLNIGLDFLFIFGFNWGVAGAALATVIAQAVSAVVSLIYIVKRCPILHISKEDFITTDVACKGHRKWVVFSDTALIFRMLTTGFSMAMMLSIVAMGSVILQSGINGLGKRTIAAHTAGRKIMEVVMNPFAAIGAAAATYSGQNYGAGKMKRINEGMRDALIMATIWSTISVIVICPFAPFWAGLIAGKGQKDIIDTASMYLRISIPAFYALEVLLVIRNILQGIGQRIVPIIASVFEMVGKILVIWLLVSKWKYFAICIAEPSIWIVDGILVLITFLVYMNKHGKTDGTKVDNEST